MWLTIFQNGDYPLHDKNSTNFRPEVHLWDEDLDYKYYCYILHGDFIYYGYYKNINCFMCLSYQDIEKTYEAFKNHGLKHLYTESELADMEAYQWIYLDGRVPERFCDNSENINEGVLTIMTYFDNNSIESKEIIDLKSGECLYFMKWTKSQYYSETHERQMQSLTGYIKTKDNKTIVMTRQYKEKLKQRKWVIDQPLDYRNYTFDEIMNYGNTEKTNRRNTRA